MTHRLSILAAAALFAVPAFAGRVSGIAVSAQTGEPLASVELMLSQGRQGDRGQQRVRRGPSKTASRETGARTGLDGRFSFEDVEPGDYVLSAAKAGYEGGQRTPHRVSLTEDAPNASLRVELNRSSSIEGRVVDADGDPLPGAQIELRAWTMSDDQRVLGRVRSARTDDLGRYRIFNITPGRYMVYLAPSTLTAMQGGLLHESSGVYFPQGSSPAEAATLDLDWGQSLDGVDLTAARAGETLASGTILQADGALCDVCSVTVYDGAGLPVAATRLSRAGRFAIHGLAAGQYSFAARAPRGADLAVESVYLADGRPVELALRLVPGQPVSGTLVPAETQGSEEITFDRASIRLSPVNGSFVGRPIGGRVSGDGAFEVRSAPPGGYRVSVFSLPSNGYLRSVSQSGSALPGGVLRVVGDGPVSGVELEIAFDGGEVTGQARGEDEDSPAPPDGMVFLVPLEKGPEQRTQIAGYRGEGGDFGFRGVAPGKYLLFASRRNFSWDWGDSAVMAGLARRAERIEVKANEAVEASAPFLESR